MTKISATILTFNEEKRIEACLESLRGIADEIIVVDSFSTDSTVEICDRHGCRVSRRKLAGFGAQRQYATSLTTHSYVLAIDADEVLSPALRQSLLKLKEGTLTHRGYAFPRLNFFCGFAVKHCGWYPDVQVRLFDKRYANWNLRDVHEKVIFRDSVQPHLLRGDLLHYRCDTQREYAGKLEKLADIKSHELATAGGTISPIEPVLKGMRAFFDTYIARGGILDGSVGLALSRHHYHADKCAYSMARQLRKKKQTND